MSDPLAPARGILIGLVIGLVFWILLALAIFGESVMHELGRRAVEQGVIP